MEWRARPCPRLRPENGPLESKTAPAPVDAEAVLKGSVSSDREAGRKESLRTARKTGRPAAWGSGARSDPGLVSGRSSCMAPFRRRVCGSQDECTARRGSASTYRGVPSAMNRSKLVSSFSSSTRCGSWRAVSTQRSPRSPGSRMLLRHGVRGWSPSSPLSREGRSFPRSGGTSGPTIRGAPSSRTSPPHAHSQYPARVTRGATSCR